MPDQGWEAQGGFYVPVAGYEMPHLNISVTAGASAYGNWTTLLATSTRPYYVVGYCASVTAASVQVGKIAIGFGAAAAEATVAELPLALPATVGIPSQQILPFPTGPIPAGQRIAARIFGTNAAAVNVLVLYQRADIPLRSM